MGSSAVYLTISPGFYTSDPVAPHWGPLPPNMQSRSSKTSSDVSGCPEEMKLLEVPCFSQRSFLGACCPEQRTGQETHKDSKVLRLPKVLNVGKKVCCAEWVWASARTYSDLEINSSQLYVLRLTSDLGCPIKNLLDLTPEEWKIAFSDWYQGQGLGAGAPELLDWQVIPTCPTGWPHPNPLYQNHPFWESLP